MLKECIPNGIFTTRYDPNTTYPNSNFTKQDPLLSNWTRWLIYNNGSNSPISGLTFGLSRPCGNGYEEYMNRNVDLGKYYTEKISSCSYRGVNNSY